MSDKYGVAWVYTYGPDGEEVCPPYLILGGEADDSVPQGLAPEEGGGYPPDADPAAAAEGFRYATYTYAPQPDLAHGRARCVDPATGRWLPAYRLEPAGADGHVYCYTVIPAVDAADPGAEGEAAEGGTGP
jgi:hypothetical protein